MEDLFSQTVATGAWRAAATRWIHEELDAVGRRVTGPVDQPRIRPWSTQLVVPTDTGTVWFKANVRPPTSSQPCTGRSRPSSRRRSKRRWRSTSRAAG